MCVRGGGGGKVGNEDASSKGYYPCVPELKCPYGQNVFFGFGISITSKMYSNQKKINCDAFFVGMKQALQNNSILSIIS